MLSVRTRYSSDKVSQWAEISFFNTPSRSPPAHTLSRAYTQTHAPKVSLHAHTPIHMRKRSECGTLWPQPCTGKPARREKKRCY